MASREAHIQAAATVWANYWLSQSAEVEKELSAA